MLEIYLISSVICFILMIIFGKIHDGNVLISDLFFNLLFSLIPFINVIVVFVMFVTTDKVFRKKVF